MVFGLSLQSFTCADLQVLRVPDMAELLEFSPKLRTLTPATEIIRARHPQSRTREASASILDLRHLSFQSSRVAVRSRMYSQVGLVRCLPSSRVTGHSLSPLARQVSRTYSRSITSSSSIQRLSRFWIPTVGAERSRDAKDESHELLIRAGYVRQAHAGIFHMLPLGNRVQQKLEALIDKHMESIGMQIVYNTGRCRWLRHM